MNMEMRAFDEATSTVGAVIADLRIREQDFKMTGGDTNDLGSMKDMQQLLQGLNPDESDDYVYIAKSKDHVNPSTQVNILNEGVMKKGDKF